MSRRFTTVHDRYHVCSFFGKEGELSGTSMTKADAFDFAKELLERDESIDHVEVFDSMARRNMKNIWKIEREK